MKSLAIIAKLDKPIVQNCLKRVESWAKKNNVELYLCSELAPLVGSEYQFSNKEKLWEAGEILLSFGGDGTMLSSARAIGSHNTPILGVNTGSLGFLTEIPLEDLEKSLDRVKNKDFYIEKRMVLQARIEEREDLVFFGLNDIVIDKGNFVRVVDIP